MELMKCLGTRKSLAKYISSVRKTDTKQMFRTGHHVKKGNRLYITGRLVVDTYVNQQDISQEKAKVVVNTLSLVESENSGPEERKERHRQESFSDTSQWWHNRSKKVDLMSVARKLFKKIPKLPEFRHKCTNEALWIKGRLNPQWVKAALAAMIQRQAKCGDGLNKNSSDSSGDVTTLSKGVKEAAHIGNKRGIWADSSTYVCLLQECIKIENLEVGRQVHALMIQSGLKPNIFLLGTLVNMYAKCGSVVDARLAFDKMPKRNVFACTIMVAGYAKHGCGRKAFEIYQQMIQEGVKPNKVTFVCVLNACASLTALEKGKKVHADIIEAGMSPDIILETSLVDMYAKCGSIEDARQVFDKMAQRNVVSWSAMIAGYAQHGRGLEALDIYQRMIQEGVLPNNITFICVLKACASIGALEKGKDVHADLLKAEIALDIVLETALVNMYVKCGSINDAHQVFNNMAHRNVVSWSAMIAGYAQLGSGMEALEMYEQMVQEGVAPNKVTFISVLNACASLAALEKGKEVHADIIKAGIAPDVTLETALAAMYAKSGNMSEARLVFDNMAERNVVSWSAMIGGYAQHGCCGEAFELYEQMIQEGVLPNNVTFSSILTACASLGALEKGKEVHAYIIKVGIVPDIILENTLVNMYVKCGSIKDARDVFDKMAEQDVVSWSAMISGYAQHGCGRDALQLFGKMKQEGLKPNVVSWSTIIAGYAQHGCGREALEMYEQMVQEGVAPNNVTFNCVLKACAGLGALDKGKKVHADIIKAGVVSDVILENALVNMYAKCGSVKDAREVFDNMSEQDVVSWNGIIAAYGQHGCGREALQLYEQMQQGGVTPDCITFTCVLSSCSHVGLVDEGCHYFYSLSGDHGLAPTGEHFGCMVDLLGRAGQLYDAEEFIKKMPIEPGPSVWGTLLGACKIHGNVEVAERVAKCAFK